MYQIYFRYTRSDWSIAEGWVVQVDANRIGLTWASPNREEADRYLLRLRRLNPMRTYELWFIPGNRVEE